MDPLYKNLELTYPKELPRIIVESANVSSRYDAEHIIRKISRSRGTYVQGLQRIRHITLLSNRRNAFNRWRRVTKFTHRVVMRFWWTILKSQTRRARFATSVSSNHVVETSDTVIARLDASFISIRDIARTGRIALTELSEILGVKLCVPKSDRKLQDDEDRGGPVVIGALKRERSSLLRMRLVKLDGCKIRMNAKDVRSNSIRIPFATLRAMRSKMRSLLLRDPIYIIAGFRDPMIIVNDIRMHSSPHLYHFARIL